MKHFMTVDPGLDFGIAKWKEGELWPEVVEVFVHSKTKNKTDWFPRAQESYVEFREHLLCEPEPSKVYFEWPDFFANASTRRGDQGKLQMLIGMMVGACLELDLEVELVNVRDWKGNLPKHVVEAQVKRILTPRFCARNGIKTHAYDAVGIGLYLKGEL